jgi:hypothetical protein
MMQKNEVADNDNLISQNFGFLVGYVKVPILC